MKNKSKKKRKILLVILFLIIILTVWYEKPVTEIISIRGKGKIDTPVRFALVTDLHSCYYGKDQKRLTDLIDNGKVDGVLLSGDIFDDKFSDTNAKIFMEAISKKYPCFYVTGNHEFWSKRENETKEYLKSMGVTVLEGNASTIEIKGNKIDICGVDDPTYMKNDEWRSQLTKASEKSDPEHYRILLSHRPEKVDVYREYDFDLVVSGHAHGGQWTIPFLHRGIAAPNQGLLPKYVDGRYDLGNGTEMIVSRGLARERMPYPRFFNQPEVVLIDIGK